MSTRRTFVAAMAALSTLTVSRSAKADGAIQTVTNQGQIVSTGSVWVTQAAGGQQNVYDQYGTLIATQAVGNDLQIVSTGDVHANQSAAGSQNVQGSGGSGSGGVCTPGDYRQGNGCVQWCAADGCSWLQFCCDQPKKKCCH